MEKRISKSLGVLTALLVILFALAPSAFAQTSETGTILINEIESKDASGGPDWVEIINTGSTDADISGLFITDDGGLTRLTDGKTTPLASGTILKAGEVKVLEENTDFDFGLGKQDTVTLYDKNQKVLDTYSYTDHANGTWSRISTTQDASSFVDQEPTKGKVNTISDITKNQLVINEINSAPDDWVELKNIGNTDLDLTGCEIRDNSDDHRWKFADGTTIKAGGYLLIDAKTQGLVGEKDGSFSTGTFESAIGIGSGDAIRLYNASGDLIDSYSWTEHASRNGDTSAASYGRLPDGSGDFTLMPETPDAVNSAFPVSVVINEVESSSATGGPDWIELANPSDTAIDISGLIIKDNNDSHAYTIPDGTQIPAGGYFVIDETQFGFGLGSSDAVRLYDGDTLIAQTEWTDHAAVTLGLYPDAQGSEYRNTSAATPGAANQFDNSNSGSTSDSAIPWPGGTAYIVAGSNFLEDSSGLDFADGKLYAIDNGTGRFWILNLSQDGILTPADGFANGKRIRFKKDAGNSAAKGPDTEGITVDGSGFVYAASERDNEAKGVNSNVILKVDPNAPGEDLTALKEWDLTASLPQVSANMGIESVEWVSNADVEGKLFDQNTGAPFQASDYPKASSGGVFFVALEDNGHVYAYVLNDDETYTQIADIDSGLGMAMAMDYDTAEKVLWVKADNGSSNQSVKLTLNGTATPSSVLYSAEEGLDSTGNYEGFAIAGTEYVRNGRRPVFYFLDGVKTNSLTAGTLNYNSSTDSSGQSSGTNTSSTTQKSEGQTQKIAAITVSPLTGVNISAAPWMILIISAAGIFGFLIIRKNLTA